VGRGLPEARGEPANGAPGIGTLFNLADCYEHLGKTASAWTAFSETADMAKRAAQPDRESIARERAAALAPKLAKMRLDMKGAPPPGFEIRLDGKPLPAAVVGTEIPVDPGDHKVLVSATGKAPREVAVRIEVAAAVVLVISTTLRRRRRRSRRRRHRAAASDRRRRRRSPVAEARRARGRRRRDRRARRRDHLRLRASSQWSDAKSTCAGNTCDDKGYSGWQDARSSATIGTVGFVAGGVLAAAAVVLWITAPSPSRTGAR